MFKVEVYNPNPSTGEVEYRISFDIGTGVKIEEGTTFLKARLDFHISEMKRDYILHEFSKFVNHARIIAQTGDPSFYMTQVRSDSLERCQKANQYFQKQPFHDVCHYIITLEKDLFNILPASGNNSFQSSENCLREIIEFAKSVYTKPILTT